MTYISVDIDLDQFPDRVIAAYVAANDKLWNLCFAAHLDRLEREGSGTRAEWNRLWDQAVKDGLIADVPSRTI